MAVKKKVKKDTVVAKKVNNDKVIRKNKKKKRVSCLQCIKAGDDGGTEGKYRVAAPELMQDTFMSDSEDEGGEVECPIEQQQQYRYMNSEAGTLQRAKPMEDSVVDGHLWPSNNDTKLPNVDRQPVDIGFLVSFVVDARGGAMRAKRRGGVRIIVPPAACSAPTRVTCRAATKRAPAAAPPPLMEGEALASRLLELQPQGAKFLAPVIIEVPIYTASSPDREIVILRSDTGETWQDHYLHNNDNQLVQEALSRERASTNGTCESYSEDGEKVTRIVATDFPHFLAVVSRVRQEVHVIGPDGGTVCSTNVPKVMATFPPSALTKRIRVGLQGHRPPCPLPRGPRHVALSPVVTVEPRRRKFHRAITLTAPRPQPQNDNDKLSPSNLRLLCSIMGGQARAVWEDVTGSTPLTLTADTASFTTTVSARFWLINCQNVSDATKLATELYREMLLVPFEVRIVVLGKRLDSLEGRLLILYITDRYNYETLLQQEHYTEIAHSTSVRLSDGRDVYLEFSGNLIPVTKCGTQPQTRFEAFKDNRVEFPVRVKHHEEKPTGRIYFMNEPKVPKGEQSQTPACVLDVELPDNIAPRAGKSQLDCLNLDQSGFDALNDELWGDHHRHHHHSIGPPSIPYPIDEDDIHINLNGNGKVVTNGSLKHDTNEVDGPDTKPHVNGNTILDSNKTKATFDSDEDKTPHNTLEKGKKKDGFLGGLADKVKHVFSSHDEDDKKDASPKHKKDKTPPKDDKKEKDDKSRERDSKSKEKEDKSKEKKDKKDEKPKDKKEKSPPKSRLIKEDLLEKVDDMFKDVRTKPHAKDNVETEIHSTKAVIEDRPALEIPDENIYENIDPVDTPISVRTEDPFTKYSGCCDKLHKHKHTHDETSKIVDMIEQEAFSQKEKLKELDDRVQTGAEESLDKVQKEKDNVEQKYKEVLDDIADKSQQFQNQFEDVERALLANAHKTFDHSTFLDNERSHTVAHAAGEIKSNVQSGLDAGKEKSKDIVEIIEESAHETKDKLKSKAHNLETSADDKLHEAKDSIDNVKDDASEAANDIKEEGKKKKKQGKGFISGFVSNIFDKKDKAEKDIKNKLNEGKDTANSAIKEAKSEKNKIEEELNKKKHEAKKETEKVAQDAQELKDDASRKMQESKDKAQQSIDEKVSQTKEAAGNLTQGVENAKDAASNKLHDIKESAEQELEAKRDQAKEGAEKLAKSAQKAGDEISEKIHESKNKVQQGADDLVHKAEDDAQKLSQSVEHAKDATSEKLHDIKESAESELAATIEQAKNEAEKLAQSAEDAKTKVQLGISDTVSETKKGAESLVHKAEDGAHKVVQSVEQLKDTASDKQHEARESAERELAKLNKKKDQALSDAAQSAKEAKDGASKKANETKEKGKGFISGIVSNIFDKKDKAEKGVKNKINEGKDAANEVAEKAKSGKNKLEKQLSKKKEEAKKEAEKLAQSAQEAKDEIQQRVDEKLSQSTDDFIHKTEDRAQKAKDAASEKLHDARQSAEDKIAEHKAAATELAHDAQQGFHDGIQHLSQNIKDVKDDAANILHETDAAIDKKVNQGSEMVHDLASQAEAKKTELKDGVTRKTEEFRQVATDLVQSAHEAKDDALHNISETKHTAEQRFDEKVHESEQAINDEINKASSKKDEILDQINVRTGEFKDGISEKHDEFTHGAQDLMHSAHQFTEDASNKLHETKGNIQHGYELSLDRASAERDDIIKQVSIKSDEFQEGLTNKKKQLKGNADSFVQSFHTTKDYAFDIPNDEMEIIRREAERTTDDIKKSAEEALNSAAEKSGNLKDNIKVLHDQTLSTFDDYENAAKDAAHYNWDDVQSNTRDTLATFHDDVHSVASSAQDTLHSFQSSAGNTFDSLDDSAREVLGHTEHAGKELFGKTHDAFEGFQVSSDNQLCDLSADVDEAASRLHDESRETSHKVAGDADEFATNLNNLATDVFGLSGKGFMKDSSAKLLEAEKSQAAPSPPSHKKNKNSGIPKLKKKK